MKVFITGAGGFVGHHLLDYLMENTKWEFVVTDSFRHGGVSKRLFEIQSKYNQNDRIKVIVHDLSTPIDPITEQELGDVNVIVNVASRCSVDESIEDPVRFIKNNIDLQLNLLEYARKLKNLKTFIQISTDEVFGDADNGMKFAEWHSFTPSNPYSASKASQESICNAYWNTYDLPIIVTNTMNMFGERQSVKSFIPKSVDFLLKNKPVPVYSNIQNGKILPCSRFYLYIKNQSDAIKFLIEKFIDTPHKASDGLKRMQRFNITDGNEFFNDDIVKMVASILDINREGMFEYVDGIKFRPGHDTRYDLDGNKLISLGWNPPFEFHKSLEKTVKWFKDNPNWLKYL